VKEIDSTRGPSIQPRGINDLNTYKELIRYLINNNYNVVLIGKDYENIIKLEKMGAKPYGNSKFQSVKNDFLIINNCKFYIGNNSGPYAVALALRKPMLMINFIGLVEATVSTDLSIYLLKKIFNIDQQKLLSIHEYLQCCSLYHHSSEFFEKNREKFCIVDNTEHEILEACKEFIERYNYYCNNDIDLFENSPEQNDFINNLDYSHACAYVSHPVLARINFAR
jgi:putative glycosyltransferase (TIGR04372 family)